ncbi:hypothetical protein QFZ82_000671 [Streptomyces sp. V4I23]|nr:hypothetical protein [Streptomyces sp. V4I23]MDQ1006186.1 hypothetical protein [Streptomyces sp. V4I23]
MRADTYDVLVVNAAAVGSPLVALATGMYEAFVIGRPQEPGVEQHHEAGARRLLTGLVRVLPGSPAPLRRRLTRQEAGEEGWRVAQWLAESERRLLVTHGGLGEPETVELAHEALVSVWPALQEQVRADSEFLAGRAELSHERERWTKGNRAPGLLPGPLQLAAVEGRLAGREEELDDEDRDFLRLARQRRRARRIRMRAAWTAVAVVLALIAALGTFLVHQSRISAQREAEGRSRLLAGFSAEVAKQDPGQAALIAMAAYRIAPTDEARNAMLRRYDQFKDAARVLSGTEGQIEDAVTSVDGTVTLVTSGNGRATLFVRRAGGGVLRHHLGLAEMAFHPLVSRDGRRRPCASLGPDVERALLDSSGRYAAAKTPGGMLELWSAKAGQRPRRMIGPLGPLGANDLFTGDGFTFDFTGRDGEFYLANGSSVRFQQASDPGHFESYDFETNQYFMAAAKDGRTLLRALSASGFRGNGGSGRLDLIRLDPELWKRHLCRTVGRDLGEDERRGMPTGLPDRICPA